MKIHLIFSLLCLSLLSCGDDKMPKPTGQLSLEYPQAEKAGPPFSVDEAEIRQLFDGAIIEKLASTDLTGEGFARRRFLTSSLIETSWLIRW